MYRWFFLIEVLIFDFSKCLEGQEYVNPCASGQYYGDAALSDRDVAWLKQRKRTRRAVTSEPNRIWPDGIIPYAFKDTFSGKDRVIIQQAIRHWETQTCLSFVPRTSEKNHIVFQQEGQCGCCSYVGRLGGGRSQGVNLGANCIHLGTVIHELGHVIGFWHEHTRPDRDAYVSILRKHVMKGEMKNFRRLGTDEIDSLGVRYDFDSIMHYAPTSFSWNGMDATILPRPSSMIKIGQREKLSELDRKQANLLYKCPACYKTTDLSKGSFSFLPSTLKPGEPTTCIWRILASPGEKIMLTFHYTYFKFSCRKVSLEIRKGKHHKGELLHRFCKKRNPEKTITIEAESIWMRFKYGHQFYYGGAKDIGVKFDYKVQCGGKIRKSHGKIFSPNYPDYYEKNQTCLWEITVPKNHKVALKFQMFDMEKAEKRNCNFDYVQITDGKTGVSMGKFCGSRMPSDQIATGNSVKIEFHSDDNVNKGGFALSFFSEKDECAQENGGCQHTCRNTDGKVTCACIKGYKLKPNGRDCEAVSQCKNNECQHKCTITLKGAVCSCRQGYRLSSDAKSCIKATSACDNNGGCQHKCTAKADGAVCSCHKGYQLSLDAKSCAKVGCGFISNLQPNYRHGWIATPDYPRPYTNSGVCKWSIKTQPGQQYKLKVEDMLITSPFTNNCSHRIFTLTSLSSGRLLKKYSACELMVSKKTYTASNALNITTTLQMGESIKFNISLRRECGGTLLARRVRQTFYSDINFNTSHDTEDQYCEWLIDGKRHPVALQFQKFRIDDRAICKYHNVKVFDGRTRMARRLGKICKKDSSLRKFQSSGTFLLVVFKTKSGRMGFSAMFKKVVKPKRRRGHVYRQFNSLKDSRRTRDFYY